MKKRSTDFEKRYFACRDPKVLGALRLSAVGIAGAGGLGSNDAVSLARAGVGRLVIADFDRLEPSNLNRQQYFVEQRLAGVSQDQVFFFPDDGASL
jgi:sulfur carrier protein ThiS adenylyltransferase